MINKEIEEAFKRALETKQRGTCIISVETLETVLQALDNSIPKEKAKDKIEIYKRLELESFNRDSIQADEYRAIIKVLQELLEEEN